MLDATNRTELVEAAPIWRALLQPGPLLSNFGEAQAKSSPRRPLYCPKRPNLGGTVPDFDRRRANVVKAGPISFECDIALRVVTIGHTGAPRSWTTTRKPGLRGESIGMPTGYKRCLRLGKRRARIKTLQISWAFHLVALA